MQSNVNVSPHILQWVMEHLQVENITSEILGYLQKWLSGERIPTFNQIEKVSKATNIPLGYFFLQTPPQEDLSFVEYRTVDSIELQEPSRNLVDVMHDMDQIQNWIRDFMITNGEVPLAFVGSQKDQLGVYQFANYVRQLIKIDINWYISTKTAAESFKLLRKAMSAVGVTIMMSGIVGNNTHRALNVDEFRAFAMVDEFAPLIFINSNDSDNAKLFSLLHEFVHICVGNNSLFNNRFSTNQKVKKLEVLCNAVAGEILVPDSTFTLMWEKATKDGSIENVITDLAQYFKCGTTVIARKAYDKQYIDYKTYQKIASLAICAYNQQKELKKGKAGGDFYRTAATKIDHRFFTMLHESVQQGKTTYTEAYRLTNTNRSTFSTLSDCIERGMTK